MRQDRSEPRATPLRLGRCEHFLAIDDDSVMLRTAARILERLGYRIAALREGAAGIAADEAGIRGIVRKPASLAELGEAVGQALPLPA